MDWQPAATLDTLRRRARLLADVRAFFAARGVWEVETPILSHAGATDPQLASFTTDYHGPGGPCRLYLHTSPEYPMKRLLAAGSGSIYQIARVFRDGELGRRHNPEFTLLEWYRLGFDQQALMTEVAELVLHLLAGRRTLATTERLSYAEAFQPLALDPHTATVAELRACAERHGIIPPPGMADDDPDPWRDLLLTHCIEPNLGRNRLTFLYNYPASQAALARIDPDNPHVAARFELYLDGVELANGFHELAAPLEQRQRFMHDNAVRAARALPTVPLDEPLLAALAGGLPDCAGVALGFDRLVMLAEGATALADVQAFPLARA